ncbi:restriction endonuclease (plasmid) [Shewanella xiamenensis]|uniref:restriction endonuclease n=1 Tax=Shewanella xiamenensis TaxID=332186 RepID=UPI0024ACA182|nr:restriction endonuclease [Shewanella xiamenensis]WHF57777.1 restriction endonuclease [Shewanella xiamenensis]
MNFEWFLPQGKEFVIDVFNQYISNFKSEAEFYQLLIVFSVFLFFVFYQTNEKWRIDKSKKKLIELNKLSISNSDEAKLLFNKLRRLDPFLFEELILTAIDRFNPNVKIIRNKRYTGDGGVDGLIVINNVKIAIQAKRYRNFINTSDVSKLEEKLSSVGASYGLFVHTGKTRPATWQRNEGSNVIIVSGARMLALVVKEIANRTS